MPGVEGKWIYFSVNNQRRPLGRDNKFKWDLNKIISPASIWNHDITEKNSAYKDAMAIFEKQGDEKCDCR